MTKFKFLRKRSDYYRHFTVRDAMEQMERCSASAASHRRLRRCPAARSPTSNR
jgi:hypothetical protein